ncbi:MAG: PfkB family carbohydrate kinase [Geodermatophilaceae bacterium]
MRGVRLVTPNAAEAAGAAGSTGSSLADVGRQAAELVASWQAGAVAVTIGSRGALLSYGDGAPFVVPAAYVAGGDSCGAGDRLLRPRPGCWPTGRSCPTPWLVRSQRPLISSPRVALPGGRPAYRRPNRTAAAPPSRSSAGSGPQEVRRSPPEGAST